jgi:hypothetical protein
MESIISTEFFKLGGSWVMASLLVTGCLMAAAGMVNLVRSRPVLPRLGGALLVLLNVEFVAGFVLICWFHYTIYQSLALELPAHLADMLNRYLAGMNADGGYGLPLYDTARPPRYAIPVWIENEKYYFWFMCTALMSLVAYWRIPAHRMRSALSIMLACMAGALFFAADPFASPLPRFFAEVAPWFEGSTEPMARMGLFMRLYPKMVFYYNAGYMWVHPPMLFVAYACITLTFATSLFMLFRLDPGVEETGYGFARFGYFLLTLGMLIGYPWALQAWGPNWWWDPKICSSIMMWSIYSTYLHTRLYAAKRGMWYFTAGLGILCFFTMLFTIISSYYFPGEHSLQ